MDKVLIVGADGFLGKHLVKYLSDKVNEIWALVYSKETVRTEKSTNSKVHYIECNLPNGLDSLEYIPENIDVMFYLAWSGVEPELRKNMEIQIKNLEMGYRCTKWAVAKKVKKIIFPGSTNEYLYCDTVIGQTTKPFPQDAYGSVKVATQYLCKQFAKDNGVDFVYAVITGIYAEDRIDNNVISYVIRKLLKKEKPSLTRLEQLWDYIYIDDAVEALYLVAQKGKDGKTYAIGCGDNWPLKKYIEIIHKLIDSSLPLGIGEVPYVDGKLPSSCIDLSELQKDTGFIPRVKFEEGIVKIIEKIKEQME